MDGRLLVILLAYNGIDMTLACLRSLAEQSSHALQVVVVDNASSDGTAETVRQKSPGIGLIHSPINLGYAGGNNLGLRLGLEEGADVFFLLNNDTLLERECIENLLSSLDAHPGAAAVGPMIRTWGDDGRISSAGGRIDWDRADAVNVGAGELDGGQYPARSVDFANGCGLMVTRAAIERVGLLDERYFMYWEETDWCTRMRRAGFDVRFESAARMRHKASIESHELGAATLYYMTRNRILFFSTHGRSLGRTRSLLHAYHGAWLGWRREASIGRLSHARAIRLAMLDGLYHRWGKTKAEFGRPGQSMTTVASKASPRQV